MNVVKKRCLGALLAFACAACCFAGVASFTTVAAAKSAEYAADAEVEAERGIATNLTLNIGGENGQIWAKVKNQFTLLPSVIIVYVELYSSTTYQESYTAMELEGREYIADLNMGETIEVSASTGGEQKYWMARARYKFDGRDWVEKTTDALLYSAAGVCLS